MRKQKWSDFFGAVCAATTVALVAASAKHVQKKYGVRNVSTLMDYKKTNEVCHAAPGQHKPHGHLPKRKIRLLNQH